MKRILYLILLVSIIDACSNGTSVLKQESIIAEINERQDRWNQILVVPNINEDDISNKKIAELMEMARENDGAYYGLEADEYEEVRRRDKDNSLLECRSRRFRPTSA